MAQSVLLKAKGLHTFKNQLSEIPEGALEEALNVVIDRDGVLNPRRGLFQYSGAFSSPTKQIREYKDRLIVHQDNELLFEDPALDGTFNAFSGSYTETEAGLRIKSIESNGNFYFTTSEGIKKISADTAADLTTAADFITQSGGVKALSLESTTDYSIPGFFNVSSKVAYKILWGITDANNNLILGSPSARSVVENKDPSNNAVVSLTFPVPEEITGTSFFYQIYRTAMVPSAQEPSEEYQLVLEGFITAGEIAAGLVTVQDITPDDFRASGAFLYTNPVSGQGVSQANEPPPFAKDIELYKNYTFYANTSTRQSLTNALLGIPGIVSGDKVYITDGADTTIYTFRGEVETYTADFTTVVTLTIAALKGDYLTIPAANDDIIYKVWLNDSVTPVPEPTLAGTSPIEVDLNGVAENPTDIAQKIMDDILASNSDFNITNAAGVLTIITSNNGNVDTVIAETIGDSFSYTQDDLGDGEKSADGLIIGTANFGATIDITSTAHGLVTGETIIIETLDTTLGGIPTSIAFDELVVTVLDPNTLQVTNNLGVDGGGTTGNWFINDVFLPRIPLSTENGPSTSQQIDQAAQSLVKIINLDNNGLVNSFYLSSSLDVPGQFFLEQRDLVGTQFSMYASNSTVASKFNPALGVQSVNESKIQSSNETKPNRIFYSKLQQPEAVPLVNFIDIGPQDDEIQRIVALRDSLFIFKQDGIYRLSGDIAPFQVAPFDFSLTLQAADTAVVLNNQVHCFTTQGVAQVTDTGVNVISRSIEDKLLEITREGFTTKTSSFGVSYETDRSYLLFTVTTSLDTVATQCFRYNSFTNTWTRWEMLRTCGLVNRRDDKLYVGAGDLTIVEKERKGLDRTDYADRQFDNEVTVNGVDGTNVAIGTITSVEIGDALLQTQYLTLSQFNRLLKRLDIDTGVTNTDYFSALNSVAGEALRAKVTALATKLDLDAGVVDADYVASLGGGITFVNIQDDFNIIINKLNSDAGVSFVDYDESTGTTPIEGVVLENLDETEGIANTVRLNFSFPFVAGLVVHYKAIPTNIIYSPQVFGDPTTFKQVNEGTYLFENNNFTFATVGYKSDLSPAFENITFTGAGIGDWGQFNWSEINWGGISSAKPFRTYIPLQKQRCRFLQPQFIHKVAFEKWSLFGISLTVRPYSTRAYK